MSLVSNKMSKVFLSKDKKIDTIDKIDIILSPEFYWVRVFDIPVKSISQARIVLPTLFEDIIENVRTLSYQVQKLENNRYLCFAYENRVIFDAIKNSGVNLSLVNSVYFAQNECQDFEQFSDGDKAFSYTQDKILVKIPKALLVSDVNINEHIEKVNLSSNKVEIKLYNNLLSSKQIYLIIAACVLFSILNIFKIFDYSTQTKDLDNQIEKFKTTSNMPNSMLQVNSIINSEKKEVKQQIAKRDIIEYVISSKEFKLKDLEIQSDVVELNFENADKRKVDEFLSKKYKIISSNVKDMNLNVRIKL